MLCLLVVSVISILLVCLAFNNDVCYTYVYLKNQSHAASTNQQLVNASSKSLLLDWMSHFGASFACVNFVYTLK